MPQVFSNRQLRRKFGKVKPILDIPDLLEIQKESYGKFFQKYLASDNEGNSGLLSLLKKIPPVRIPIKKNERIVATYSLEFEDVRLSSPPQTPIECKRNSGTYGLLFEVFLRLTKNSTELDKQWIGLGVIPLMTNNGSFIINGSERVIVSQLYRSSGVYFENIPPSAIIVPQKGSRIELVSFLNETVCFIRPRISGVKEKEIQSTEGKSESTPRNPIKRIEKIAEDIGIKISTEGVTEEQARNLIDYFNKSFPKKNFPKAIPIDTLLKAFGCSNKEIEALLLEDTTLEEKPEIARKLSQKEAKIRICSLLNLEVSFDNLFFDPKNYDLGKGGRFAINQKLKLKVPSDTSTLTKEDITATVKHLFHLKAGKVKGDAVDHLGNKRVRTIEELLDTHLRKTVPGIAITLKSSLRRNIPTRKKQKAKKVLLQDLVDLEAVQTIQNRVNSFFTYNELCQFLEQDNPLADISHKRRLTILGPGGFKKDAIPNAAKQVDPSHYGRICPIETPESNNVGQISSLSIYARINESGFLETPYRKVTRGKVTDKVHHLSPFEEEDYIIADGTEPLDKSGKFKNGIVNARKGGESVRVSPHKIDYIDISHSQMLGLSASLIPFLEHNDPTRALMAANMQRQAVPLLHPEAPLIGTGIERIVAKESGTSVMSEEDGVVKDVDENYIVVQSDGKEKSYPLLKYQGTNQETCIDQRPIVTTGDRVKRGEIIADGPATDQGELALGRNLVAAFIPWRGYNFEDAIVISERVVKDDSFTSIHIEEHPITVMQKEQVTTELPWVASERLRHLDENGIVKVNAKVTVGDVLVGKKVRKEWTGRSLLGRIVREAIKETEKNKKKNDDQKKKKDETFDDTSFIVPPGVSGTVIDVQVREKGLPDCFTKLITITLIIEEKLSVGDKLAGRHGNKGVISKIVSEEEMPYLEDGTRVDIILNPLGIISRRNLGQIYETNLGWAARRLGMKIEEFINNGCTIKEIRGFLKSIYKGEEISKFINKAQDEEILALAKRLTKGVPMECPSFNGASEQEIEDLLELAGLPRDGKAILFDGVTKKPFSNKVTVGVIYMMKLHHLAEDKMHARSTGDHMFITEQPEAGKASFGGQRIGEQEAWALYGYGAAHTLKEAFTIKSDDKEGRKKLHRSITLQRKLPKSLLTESFKVFIKELQGLCFDVSYTKTSDNLNDNNNWKSFGNENLSFPPEEVRALKITLASPETIRKWSHGEVLEAKIMDHRGDKYVSDGLFCQQIFGPLKDYTCACPDEKKKKDVDGDKHKKDDKERRGKKYKGYERYEGERCEKCGVDILEAKVRRERMGHIELAAPVCHVLYLKNHLRSLIKALFDINSRDLEKVIDCESYIVIDPGESEFKKAKLLSVSEYEEAQKGYSDSFRSSTGAGAICELLKETDIEGRISELDDEREKLIREAERRPPEESGNLIWKIEQKFARRISKLDDFVKSGIKIESIFLEVLPVIPPELRPYYQGEDGKIISSDLNMHYQKIISINNQLKKYPDSIDLKKRLQKAVDGLFSKGVTVGQQKKPLESLVDRIKGKEGRIREDLLGKRVDYSGRSVIASGPELKLHQCGLPKEMAIELFKPLVIGKLIKDKITKSIESSIKLIEKRTDEVWNALGEITKGYPVLLNRNPSLHRMNIQAFETVLVEGEAIKLHPLVCASFAADFDGDTMAVHVPLLPAALGEAKNLLMSTHNILSPATGKPIMKPSQDIVLGIYYMTKEKTPAHGEGKNFSHPKEVRIAFDRGELDLHARIKVMINGENVETTTGRILLFKEIIPPNIPLKFDNSKDNKNYNSEIGSKDLSELISLCYRCCGQKETALFCDRLKELGFEQATRSGISIGTRDVVIPRAKQKLITDGYKQVNKIKREHSKGKIEGEEEHRNKIWDDIAEQLKKALAEEIDSFNPLSMMVHSGARGNITQLNKLAGMQGLMNNAAGEILEQPITSSFREGLNPIEYFISNYESRKALVNKNKATQDAGHFTRKLVYALQNCIITKKDCGTYEGIELNPPPEITDEAENWIEERALGRIACEDIINQLTGEIICRKNTEINEEVIEKMVSAGIAEVKIRSPLTCRSEQGLCALCYGWDLSRRKMMNIGEAVGIIAAQSIGEPATQFSIGAYKKGVRVTATKESEPTKVEDFFKAGNKEDNCVLSKYEGRVKAIKDGKLHGEKVKRIIIINAIGKKEEHKVSLEKEIIVAEGDFVKLGDSLTEGEVDPYRLLTLKGRIPTAQFLIDNLQEFFKRQGSEVNRKHFEIVLSEMLKYVLVFGGGDSNFTPGEEVKRTTIEKENEKLIKGGKEPALFEPVLSTINKLATTSEGFLSNISFEDTPRKLANAALEGRIDYLKGIQENVILGRLIPVGTGHPEYTGFKCGKIKRQQYSACFSLKG